MSSSLTAGAGTAAGALAEVASLTETAEGCLDIGGRGRERARGEKEIRLKLAALGQVFFSVLANQRPRPGSARLGACIIVPRTATSSTRRIGDIYRKKKTHCGDGATAARRRRCQRRRGRRRRRRCHCSRDIRAPAARSRGRRGGRRRQLALRRYEGPPHRAKKEREVGRYSGG